MRSFRCADALWELVKGAASGAEMSTNEWVLTAIRQALKDGVQGEGGVDVEAVSSLAEANALSEATSSAMQLEKAMERHRLFWAAQMAKLEAKAKQKPKIK